MVKTRGRATGASLPRAAEYQARETVNNAPTTQARRPGAGAVNANEMIMTLVRGAGRTRPGKLECDVAHQSKSTRPANRPRAPGTYISRGAGWIGVDQATTEVAPCATPIRSQCTKCSVAANRLDIPERSCLTANRLRRTSPA